MLIHSAYPWIDVEDFRLYRPEVLDCLRNRAADVALVADRQRVPFDWKLTVLSTQQVLLALTPRESALRRFFKSYNLDTDTWSDLNDELLASSVARFNAAAALAANFESLAPLAPADELRFDSLSPVAAACLRTMCLETSIRLCPELEGTAKELVMAGYASVDLTGHMRPRCKWEVSATQRKLERLRQTFHL